MQSTSVLLIVDSVLTKMFIHRKINNWLHVNVLLLFYILAVISIRVLYQM